MINNKRKKWLIAFYVSFGEEKLVKIWTGKVSYDVTDVTVPLQTLFYFFSEQNNVNLTVTSMKLSEISVLTAFEGEYIPVQGQKLYCCGKKKGNDLILNEDGKISCIRDFFKIFNEFKIEFV